MVSINLHASTRVLFFILAWMAFSTTSVALEIPADTGYSLAYKQFKTPTEKIPKYFSMEKIVVNFRGEGRAKFLAIDLKFMSYYPEIVETEMEYLRPILKNNIDRLLRNQSYSQLRTPTGPDELRKALLKVAQDVLEYHNLYPRLLMNVYLGRFVMQ